MGGHTREFGLPIAQLVCGGGGKGVKSGREQGLQICLII